MSDEVGAGLALFCLLVFAGFEVQIWFSSCL